MALSLKWRGKQGAKSKEGQNHALQTLVFYYIGNVQKIDTLHIYISWFLPAFYCRTKEIFHR